MVGMWRRLFGNDGALPDDEGDGADRPFDGDGPEGLEPETSERSADEEYDLACRIAEVGDFEHAAHHLAIALAAEPTNTTWRHTLEKWVDQVEDPDVLVPVDSEMWYGDAAVRAYAMARLGDTDEAVNLIVQVDRSVEEPFYTRAWALDWLEEPGALQQVSPNRFGALVGALVQPFKEAAHLCSADQAALERILQLIDRHGPVEETEDHFELMHIAAVRKAGRFDDAEAAARRFMARQPGFISAVALANVLRHRDLPDEALAMMRQALAFEPDDVAIRNDIADTLFDEGRFTEAAEWYAQVLEREPEHDWALPSYWYCRYAQDQDEAWAERLKDLAEEDDNRRAGWLVQRFYPYVGQLPEPADATANILRQLPEEDFRGQGREDEPSTVNVKISHLEAPSNQLAFDLWIRSLNAHVALTVEVGSVAEPDPRDPIGPVEYALWEYEGTVAKPAVGPPQSSQVIEAVVALATRPFHDEQHWQHAYHLARRLGPEKASDLLATMVHPPMPPASVDPLEWVVRVQTAAAQIVANLDRGWAGSLRRRMLLDIARGPRDWATESAIIALRQVANQEPEARPEIRKLYRQLLGHVPKHGYCCYLYALLCNWLMMRDLPDAERQMIQDYWQQLEDEGASSEEP